MVGVQPGPPAIASSRAHRCPLLLTPEPLTRALSTDPVRTLHVRRKSRHPNAGTQARTSTVEWYLRRKNGINKTHGEDVTLSMP